jgi:hypothetical protein
LPQNLICAPWFWQNSTGSSSLTNFFQVFRGLVKLAPLRLAYRFAIEKRLNPANQEAPFYEVKTDI